MEPAVLLVEPPDVAVAGRLERVLAILGVTSRQMTVTEFLALVGGAEPERRCHLLAGAPTFARLLAAGERAETAGWHRGLHSAFVFAGETPGEFERVARLVTGDPGAVLAQASPGAEWAVTGEWPEFCQSMSGVRTSSADAGGLAFWKAEGSTTKIIHTGKGVAFFRHEFHSVPVFLSTGDIVEVAAPLRGRNFDVRPYFLAAVPVVLYAKWAFATVCWRPPQTRACLVIDDPLLKPRYGFLKYDRLLALMERVNFSTSIAFIPWNWNRSSRKVARLFRENPRRLSLSVHGCDHTGGEFGSRHPGRLAWKFRTALDRMARHQARTGVAHDAVMVFPQGVFSSAAMAALKQADFTGVVNTEVLSTDPRPRPIRIGDCWDTAVMNYDDCAIFTRRYPWQGLENFAFDILLGKACLVVVHHNDCYDDCRHVAEFIERLNGLNARLVWSGLADVVRHGFRQRDIAPGLTEIEMYGREIRVENPGVESHSYRVRKRESAPNALREIRADGEPVAWRAGEGHIAFEIGLRAGEGKTAKIFYQEPAGGGFAGENLQYRLKTMARRHLCEFRDNYLRRKPVTHAGEGREIR